MPFTFAHPAAVLPLKKKWPGLFDSTALILGSMAPDFEYFLRFKAQGVIGHTPGGFFYFNLPLVCIAALLWHYILKKPFVHSIPAPFQRYFIPALKSSAKAVSFSRVPVFILSAIFGMMTHVFWDAFTHADGFFVKRLEFLTCHLNMGDMNIPVYKVLQHGSTLAGLGIIAAYLYLNGRKIDIVLPGRNRGKQVCYWASVLLITAGIFLYRILFTLDAIRLSHYGIYIVSLLSGVIIAITAVSAIFNVFRVYDT